MSQRLFALILIFGFTLVACNPAAQRSLSQFESFSLVLNNGEGYGGQISIEGTYYDNSTHLECRDRLKMPEMILTTYESCDTPVLQQLTIGDLEISYYNLKVIGVGSRLLEKDHDGGNVSVWCVSREGDFHGIDIMVTGEMAEIIIGAQGEFGDVRRTIDPFLVSKIEGESSNFRAKSFELTANSNGTGHFAAVIDFETVSKSLVCRLL